MDPSPYSSPQSANVPPTAAPVPGNTTPRTIGTLNIIFGTILLIGCGLCYGGTMLSFYLLFPAMMDSAKNTLVQAQQQMQERIDRLEAEAAASEDDNEKADLRTQAENLKRQKASLAQNPAATMDTDSFKKFLQNPTMIGYVATDIVSGMILNFLMLISGVGLIKYRASGHRLAIKVFIAKVVRLALLQGFNIAVVMPITVQMNQAFAESQSNNPFVRMGGGQSMASSIVMAVMMVVAGCIYPVVALWLLNKPENKAACTN